MQAITKIDAGICGFCTEARAVSEDGMSVEFSVSSGCEKIGAFADALAGKGPVNAYAEITPGNESVIMATGRECLQGCCSGCAVPAGIFKSMQVAAGLALPKDVTIHIAKE